MCFRLKYYLKIKRGIKWKVLKTIKTNLPSPIARSPPSFKSMTPPSSTVSDVVSITRSPPLITPDGATWRLERTSLYWICSVISNLPSAMMFMVEIVNLPLTVLPCEITHKHIHINLFTKPRLEFCNLTDKTIYLALKHFWHR